MCACMFVCFFVFSFVLSLSFFGGGGGNIWCTLFLIITGFPFRNNFP